MDVLPFHRWMAEHIFSIGQKLCYNIKTHIQFGK
jgi:hypothetical protein